MQQCKPCYNLTGGVRIYHSTLTKYTCTDIYLLAHYIWAQLGLEPLRAWVYKSEWLHCSASTSHVLMFLYTTWISWNQSLYMIYLSLLAPGAASYSLMKQSNKSSRFLFKKSLAWITSACSHGLMLHHTIWFGMLGTRRGSKGIEYWPKGHVGCIRVFLSESTKKPTDPD